jgi:hypothetical protein
MSAAFAYLLAMVNTKIGHYSHTRFRLSNTTNVTAGVATHKAGNYFRSQDKENEASFIQLKWIQVPSLAEKLQIQWKKTRLQRLKDPWCNELESYHRKLILNAIGIKLEILRLQTSIYTVVEHVIYHKLKKVRKAVSLSGKLERMQTIWGGQ